MGCEPVHLDSDRSKARSDQNPDSTCSNTPNTKARSDQNLDDE